MKVTVNGAAVVITSALKLEEVENIKKGNAKALTLYGGEDGKEPVFQMGIAKSGSGSISEYGVEFSPIARGEEKLATVTVITENVEDVKEWFAEKYGSALVNLKALEESLPEVSAEIKSQKQAILDCIEVAG